ncbi:hypothetical protein [Curtobacterium sp. L1-20]|uniref:hypothetical protein n=1 Tax=Curtobacterium sp. L1-20 TaxID=3138181 RepID=UPI003B5160EC
MPFLMPDQGTTVTADPGSFPTTDGTGRTLGYALVAFDRTGIEAHDPDGAPTDHRPKRPGALRRAARRVSDRALAAGPADEPPTTAPDGDERRLLSLELADRLRRARDDGDPYTDVFVAAHGWLVDYEEAVGMYDAWFDVCASVRPGRLDPDAPGRPMVVAVHWPSQPNTRRDRHAEDPIPLQDFPAGADGQGAPEHRPSVLDLVDSVVPLASFWLMEHRASTVGRRGVAALLALLQEAGGPDLRVHLAGHSFGARVLVEALTGRSGRAVAPVDSLFLIEGAVSAWSFCTAAENPYGDPDGASVGLVAGHRVRGPVVATTSRFDRALGRMFPAAHGAEVAVARLRGLRFPFGRLHVAGDPAVPPRLGALGIWGFAGTVERTAVLRRDTTTDYAFRPGALHHLVADAVVDLRPSGGKTWDDPISGAHANIVHPALAAAFWQAVEAAPAR